MSTKKASEDHSLFPNSLKESNQKDAAAPNVKGAEPVAEAVTKSEVGFDGQFSEFIVVVDDSAPNLIIVSGILKRYSFGSLQFKDGKLASDFLHQAKKEELAKIKAVFSDFMMPNLDGLGLLRALRKSESLKHLPFVMFTSNADKNVIREAAALGVNGYILKPVTSTMMAEKLAALFPGRAAVENVPKTSTSNK